MQKDSSFQFLKRIILFAKPFKKTLQIISGCILMVTIINTFNNYFLSQVFNIIQKHGTNMEYLDNALLFMAITAILTIFRIIIVGFQNKIEINYLDVIIPNYLNHQSIMKFFSFSNGQHINEHSGVKQSIVTNGTTSIQNQINLITNQFLPSFTAIMTSIVVLFYANWTIGILFILSGLIFAKMMLNHNAKIIPGIRKIRDQRQLNSRLISELYRLVSLVKNENKESRSLEDLSMAQQKHQDFYVETWRPGNKRVQNIRWISNSINYTIRVFVVYLLFKGQITMGSLFLIFTYSTTFLDSLWQITSMHKQFLVDRINIERYLELLEVVPDIKVSENPIHPKKFFGEIEFKNICFQYQRRTSSYEYDKEEIELQDNLVLSNISFKINQGEKIGIVGESGSGKSTLASLLRRSFDPQSGQILIDGHDLRLLDLSWFLENLGSVDQEVLLFDRSIKDNILFGLNGKAKDFPEERLQKIAKMARIDGFFSRLEHGFDTIVGEKGVKLSGGERQRVGIARALVKDPIIMLFDEATSALDSMSEKIVQQSIDEASIGKTAIIIAHRLSTVRNCDRILVFRHGVLLSEGTHEELLESCEYYSQLTANQTLG